MPVGKAPMPTKLRVLKGDRKDRINTSEPIALDGDLTPPADMPEHVREIWDYTLAYAKSMGINKPIDRDVLVCYCEAVALHREASAIIHEQGVIVRSMGTQGMMRNPAIAVQRDAANTIRVLGHEFDFTPSGRSGIKVGEKPAAGSADRLLTG